MPTSKEFDKDCESICFECAATENLTRMGPGISLCPKCIEEEFELVENRNATEV